MDKFALILAFAFLPLKAIANVATEVPQAPTGETITATLPVTSSVGARATPVIGISYSTLVGDDTGRIEPKAGIAAGGLFEFGESKFVAEFGMIYREMGFSSKDDIFTVDYDLNYLSLPLMVKYYFSSPSETLLFIKGGVVPMLLLQKSANITGGGFAESTSDIKISSADIGVSVGIGFTKKVSRSARMLVDLGYLRGTQRLNTEGEGSIYHSGGTLTAGVSIDL
jgi:hypothetical protein